MTLLEEIIQNCPAEVLATRNPQSISDSISLGRVTFGKVDRNEFVTWAAQYGMLSKIEDHSVNVSSPLRDAALACRTVVMGAVDSINFSRPANRYMLSAWVVAGALDQDKADELLATATFPDPITEFDVRCTLWDINGNWLGG